MDEWNNKLPERLPFSKKRLPKKVIFSCVVRPAAAGRNPRALGATAR